MRWLFGPHMIMLGMIGAGKSLLACAMPAILPRLTIDEVLDLTCNYTVADQLPLDAPLVHNRPFRAPPKQSSRAVRPIIKKTIYYPGGIKCRAIKIARTIQKIIGKITTRIYVK